MIIIGDCLEVMKTLPEKSVQTCVTSPPYWGLRDYGVDGQLGLEKTPDEYVSKMVNVFREVRRVLKDDGTLWLNLGDSYTGSANSGGETTRTCQSQPNARGKNLPAKHGHNLKPKDLVGIPWRVAFALQADGWWLRQDIIWHKPNPMPESVTDRCTKAHEYIFLLSKAERYYYDADAVKEESCKPSGVLTLVSSEGKAGTLRNDEGRIHVSDGKRNRRSVWTVSTRPFKEVHFATYPPKLIEPCILAGSREGDTVLDPFNGAGTTGLVSCQHGREYIGIELNPDYVEIATRRIEHERSRTPLLEAIK